MFELHFKIIGGLLMTIALMHAIFPYYFDWKKELKHLSLVNKQIMEVHTFFIALMVFLMGVLCLFFSENLVETQFGKTISLGLGIFWFCRLFFQFFVFSAKLWKGKIFETVIHILSSIFWIYITSIFIMNCLQ